MTSPKAPGVFCLEGDWEDSLEGRMSIEPALQLLERAGEIRLIHRDIGTPEELNHYLDRWLNPSRHRPRGFDLAYFGFHGSSETMYIGEEPLSFDDLAEILEGRCAGKVLYFASCKVLAAKDEVLIEFCKRTKAKAIVGYTRNVGWVEAAAFELLLIPHLANAVTMRPAHTHLTKKYPGLTTRLGFRMAHSTWASEQRIAAAAIE